MHANVVRLRNTDADDLRSVALLHREQFADHLLGCLPEALLVEFYRAFLADTIFLVAEIDGSLSGFVLGGEDSVLRRNRSQFMRNSRWQIMGAVIVHPALWPHVWKRAVALWRPGASAISFTSVASTRLLSIAVAEAAKGQGVAGSLLKAFEERLAKDGNYGLSVHADNTRAIGFYHKSGFIEEARCGGSVFYLKSTHAVPAVEGIDAHEGV
jgi:ribosomal protein S18 acetylase RimI-like enzyme